MSFITNKRKSYLDDFKNDSKRPKIFDVIDSDNDDELQIDLDFSPTQIEPDSQWRNCETVSVTLSSGRRCRVKTRHDDDGDAPLGEPVAPARPQTASANYYRLLDEIEQNKFRCRNEKDVAADTAVNVSDSDNLWVDKYSPRRYTDLLSDESVNRSVLTWMKLWDRHVFNRAPIGDASGGGEVGDDGRPLLRAVMLAGPPGVGKTTLAAVLARHCGYRVQEMNASNERNPEQLRAKLACESSLTDWAHSKDAVNDAARVTIASCTRPVCLVIDEIDGTSQAAIDVLIHALNTPLRTQHSTTTHSHRKPNRNDTLAVRRPIICICNDLYAPALRNLRPLCLTVRVGPPDYGQLLLRVSDICANENIHIDRPLLTHLIDAANSDVRSCLNTLQFLRQKGGSQRRLTAADLEGLNLGNKDVQRGVFSVWESIFTETSLKRSYQQSVGSWNETSERSRHIMRLAQSTGDIDRVISGIHENYLSLIRFKDVSLREMAECSGWMAFVDRTNQKIASEQLYELFRYKQHIIPYFHLSFSSALNTTRGKIVWPSSAAAALSTQNKMAAHLSSFLSSSRCTAWSLSRRDLLEHTLPALSNILRPRDLRPINTQMHNEREKTLLGATVATMLATGLDYVQEIDRSMGELSRAQYVLTPNIDSLVEFPLAHSDRYPLSQSCKQLIANEIRCARIRANHVTESVVTAAASAGAGSQGRMSLIVERERAMTAAIATAEEEEAKKKKRKHFSFGQLERTKRNTTTRSGTVESDGAAQQSNLITGLLNQTVLYRFKEGYTNAIRRAVKVKDL